MPIQLVEVAAPRRAPAHYRPALQIINTSRPAVIETRSPDDTIYQISNNTPNYHKLHRRASYGLERPSRTPQPRVIRSAVESTDYDTQEELARYYQHKARQIEHVKVHQQQHREHQHRGDAKYALALVPVNRGGEIVKHAKPVVLERAPTPPTSPSRHHQQHQHRQQLLRIEPAVVERKQVKYLRDNKGDWVRVKKIVR